MQNPVIRTGRGWKKSFQEEAAVGASLEQRVGNTERPRDMIGTQKGTVEKVLRTRNLCLKVQVSQMIRSNSHAP